MPRENSLETQVKLLSQNVGYLTETVGQFIEATKERNKTVDEKIRYLEKTLADTNIAILQLSAKLEKDILVLDQRLESETAQIRVRLNVFSSLQAAFTSAMGIITGVFGNKQ